MRSKQEMIASAIRFSATCRPPLRPSTVVIVSEAK